MKNKKIISFDPSAVGTMGICIVENGKFRFLENKVKEWEEHVRYATDLIKAEQPTHILYEGTNWVYSFGKESLGVFKTFGAFEALAHYLNIEVYSINANQVTALREAIYNKEINDLDIICEPGRGKGYKFRNERISGHKLDALLVVFLWEDKKLFSRVSQIKANKKKTKNASS